MCTNFNSLLDKLREHILRIHAKSDVSKTNKKCKSKIKDESSEATTEIHPNEEDLLSIEEIDCPVYSDSNLIQSDDELPNVDSNETSTKPRFKPKVPPTEYERFIYKCQYCMLGFKRRGKRKYFIIEMT